MLKKVLINNRKVPVPVPVHTLGEAIEWVEKTLVPAGHTVTRVCLSGKILNEEALAQPHVQDIELGDNSKLELQIDSPVDLAIQTLDAMRNLASVIHGGLKPLAVECWQLRPVDRPGELDSVSHDLELILDLHEHLIGLLDPTGVEVAAIQGIAAITKRCAVSLQMARANSDWKACARLLLNRLEPLLKDLTAETESLQIRVLSLLNTNELGGGFAKADVG
jgi:hypothetical protein